MIVESITMTASVAALAAWKENGAPSAALHFCPRPWAILGKGRNFSGFRAPTGGCKEESLSPFSL
jgi:hypothetical protein